MTRLFSFLSTPLSIVALSVCSAFSHAEYDTVFIDLAQGEDMSHFRLGLGETPVSEDGEKVTSMFYLSYFNSEDTMTSENTNMGIQEVEIIALGAGGFGYLKDPSQKGGAEFDFEISQTEIKDSDYSRKGLGFRTQIFVPIVAGLQTNIGFNIRPFFLASDWDDQAELEYEYQLGLEYAFSWDAQLYAHYRYVAMIDESDNDVTLAEGTLAGLRIRF